MRCCLNDILQSSLMIDLIRPSSETSSVTAALIYARTFPEAMSTGVQSLHLKASTSLPS